MTPRADRPAPDVPRTRGSRRRSLLLALLALVVVGVGVIVVLAFVVGGRSGPAEVRVAEILREPGRLMNQDVVLEGRVRRRLANGSLEVVSAGNPTGRTLLIVPRRGVPTPRDVRLGTPVRVTGRVDRLPAATPVKRNETDPADGRLIVRARSIAPAGGG